MKIALATYAMHVGGMEVFILALAEELVRNGHEVYIVATDERGKWLSRAACMGASAYFVDGLASRSRVAHARQVGRVLRDAAFEVVINNNSWFAQASLGMLPDNVIAISVIHNMAPSVVALGTSNETACNAVVAVSPATFDDAARRLSNSGKLHLIPYGVSVPTSIPKRPLKDELDVLYCGRLESVQKGVLLLPEIVKRSLEAGVRIRLSVVGDGPDREGLARKIALAGVEDAVKLCGELDHAASLERYQEADVLIMPSFYEGLPISLLEAMAHGCIPVVSLLPGITDWMVRDGQSGLLAPAGAVEEFSGRLVRLARDIQLRTKMRQAAWQSARERFALERMTTDYLALIGAMRSRPLARRNIPELSADLIGWKDRLPERWRRPLGRIRRTVLQTVRRDAATL